MYKKHYELIIIVVFFQLWKLSSCDLCEIARNSVYQSGFSHALKVSRPPFVFLWSTIGGSEDYHVTFILITTTILVKKLSKSLLAKFNICKYRKTAMTPWSLCRHIGLARTTTREALQGMISTERMCPPSGSNSGTWYAHLFPFPLLCNADSDGLTSPFPQTLTKILAHDFQIWRDEMQLVYLDNVILPDEVDQ